VNGNLPSKKTAVRNGRNGNPTACARAGSIEVTQKIKDFTDQNVSKTFDHAQRLVQAKDAQTLITLHGEFVQSQMQLLTEQARILGEISSKTALDAAQPKS
jgi:phasin family protein